MSRAKTYKELKFSCLHEKFQLFGRIDRANARERESEAHELAHGGVGRER